MTIKVGINGMGRIGRMVSLRSGAGDLHRRGDCGNAHGHHRVVGSHRRAARRRAGRPSRKLSSQARRSAPYGADRRVADAYSAS